ncbi:MAG: site-specific integrase, partial [Candidatus Acidiferrales bacterium]
MLAIYRRVKDGRKWKAVRIKEGRGIRTSDLVGPFFIRPTINGVQERRALHSQTFAEAREEANEVEKQCEAQARGLTVGEMDVMQNSHRLPIRLVIDTYLDQKKNKRPKTIAQYTTALREFQNSLRGVKYLDEINANVLRNHMNYLTAQGYAGKTIDTRVN